MVERIQFSALERGVAGMGVSVSTAVDTMVYLAIQGEMAGIKRIWCTEHHVENCATAAPELLIPYMADATSSIRIGVAGALLRLHRPFFVAERFSFLSHMYHGRIDLGLGRGIAHPLILNRIFEGGMDVFDHPSYESRVEQLLDLLNGSFSSYFDHPSVDIWMLGTTSVSADFARNHGLQYCHGLFFTSSSEVPTGTTAVAVAGVCAESCQEATKLLAQAGDVGFYPMLVGDPAACVDRLTSLIEGCPTINEIIFMDLAIDPYKHVGSYLLLAKALRNIKF